MTCWELVGHAVELRVKGVTLVSPGVAVRLDGDDQVAVVYGGHRETVDEQAVMAAARIALQDWPVELRRAEIVVSEPERISSHDVAALAKAQAKRDRRAAAARARMGLA
jgi:hypothetical protein